MTDDGSPEHDPDPDHTCPVCEAKRDVRELLHDEAVKILHEIIAECQDDLAGGKQDMDAQVTILACSELLTEMGEPVPQHEGKLH